MGSERQMRGPKSERVVWKVYDGDGALAATFEKDRASDAIGYEDALDDGARCVRVTIRPKAAATADRDGLLERIAALEGALKEAEERYATRTYWKERDAEREKVKTLEAKVSLLETHASNGEEYERLYRAEKEKVKNLETQIGMLEGERGTRIQSPPVTLPEEEEPDEPVRLGISLEARTDNFREWWLTRGREIELKASVIAARAAWEAAMSQSGNYVADTATNPSSVTFANGRRVWIAGQPKPAEPGHVDGGEMHRRCDRGDSCI